MVHDLHAHGYKEAELTEELSYQLTALMVLHQYSDLGRVLRIENW
jgi:hygromycin-B 7''-O-kinase